ncbi:nucleoside-triphosphate diphosphatase [Streptococcus moroccensis]|uniref:dITP/XTP pyrophosphatase n=1 Tax=Streptococcus moroccensis TaxID=1451356 RepID=A0ABT9YQH8_9STRE|nr:nucleoside-triphosphate diphosphatase [Streptococcus moroccensis]MDQ0222248.1 XTP/dITP diphosphohydrolase [Streptococcus moroccensis]
MSQDIFEYKDDKDWYVGKLTDYTYISSFEDDEVFSQIQHQLYQILGGFENDGKLGEEKGLQIHVISYSSILKLMSFVVDMINQIFQKDLTVKKHQGAVLVLENDVIKSVHLPKEGIPLSALTGGGEDLGDTILIATRNEGKTNEFRDFFAKLGYGVQNLNDFPDLPEVEETGTTFEENARLKAETIAQLTGKIVLADDSGLKVDVLGGLPGVWSARFSGPDATDEKNNQKLLHELSVVFDQKDRSAQFHCTLVLAKPGKESLVVEADWPGFIAFDSHGEYGFGYDPLFIVESSGKRAAELTTEEKNTQSHRALALKKLMEVFPTW